MENNLVNLLWARAVKELWGSFSINFMTVPVGGNPKMENGHRKTTKKLRIQSTHCLKANDRYLRQVVYEK